MGRLLTYYEILIALPCFLNYAPLKDCHNCDILDLIKLFGGKI